MAKKSTAKTKTEEPKTEEPKRMGRPPFEPTVEHRKIVKMLSGLGVPQEGIARQIKDAEGKCISVDTLAKYFREELDGGVQEANAKVAGKLFKLATEDDNLGAIIFWLKTRAGWKETPQQVAFTDPDGKPAKPVTLADLYGIMATPKEDDDAGNQAQD